jgi:hypothetical protein
MALVVIPLSRVSPMLAARAGVRLTGAAGLTLMAAGFAVLATLETGSSYWHVFAGLIPFGAGMALAGAPATTAIVASLPRERQGVASAVNDVSREGIGFDSERNAVTILTHDDVVEVPETTKWEVAQRVLDQVIKLRKRRPAAVKA